MKRFVRFLFLALMALFVLFPVFARIEADQDPLVRKAVEFIDRMTSGDFAGAAAEFDENMSKLLPAVKLKEFWGQIEQKIGVMKKRTDQVRREKLDAYDVVLITCEFDKNTLDWRVVFDSKMKISGFQFVPPAPPAEYEAPPYADPKRFDEIEVTVNAGGEWPLPGTLSMPRGDRIVPAVVLVHGSGPNDRDETLGPNKPFKDLAWGLASRGIAVLRYEKRTKVFGHKIVADPALASTLTVREETIDDALAAAAFLLKEKRIDPRRIFILGHSLGGMLIPRIAAADRSGSIAGFIIMAGLTRKLDDTILEQVRYIAELDGEVSAEEKEQIGKIEDQVQKARALTDKDRNSTQTIIGACPTYWLDLRNYDPAIDAKKIKKPLLILQGERDYQVTIVDFENWKSALSNRKDVEFHLYPKLNHLFFAGEGPCGPDEYFAKHKSVDPQVVEDIIAWIDKK